MDSFNGQFRMIVFIRESALTLYSVSRIGAARMNVCSEVTLAFAH